VARYATVGFEVGSSGEFASLEGRTDAGTITRDTTTFRSGASSLKCDSGAGNTLAYVTHSWDNRGLFGYYVRAYFRFTTMPSATTRLMALRTGAATMVNARVTSAGKIQLYDEVSSAQIGSDSAATLVTGVWYRIELYCKTVSGASDEAALRLDGVEVASATGLALSDANLYQAWFGLINSPGANRVVHVDDVAINDDQGASQNSWPGDGKVLYLRPVSDNARDTHWTAGAGATTSLFDAVDNTPAVGVASGSATDTSQVKNINTADTTGNYDANMTSYTAAGLVATDTITLVQGASGGGSSTTAVGNGALKIVSNPVQSGEDTNAFGAGSAIGSWGSNWEAKWGSAQYSPSVTLGTQPVLRVGRRTTAAMELHFCVMLLAVEYTQGASTNSLLLLGA
jgi:hypothetical protein